MVHRRLMPFWLAFSLLFVFVPGRAWAAPATANLGGPGDPNHGCGNGNGNGNLNHCIPETPLPLGLPLVGLVVLGGYIIRVRRQTDPPADHHGAP